MFANAIKTCCAMLRTGSRREERWKTKQSKVRSNLIWREKPMWTGLARVAKGHLAAVTGQ